MRRSYASIGSSVTACPVVFTRLATRRAISRAVFAPLAVALDVHRDMHRVPDGLRGDRGDDLLQRDQVLAASADERAELGSLHLEPFHSGTVVHRDVRLDVHLLEERDEHGPAQREIFREQRRRRFGLVRGTIGRALGGGPHRIGRRGTSRSSITGSGSIARSSSMNDSSTRASTPPMPSMFAGLPRSRISMSTSDRLRPKLEQSALDRLFDGASR